jgi:hypothetical protein
MTTATMMDQRLEMNEMNAARLEAALKRRAPPGAPSSVFAGPGGLECGDCGFSGLTLEDETWTD